MKQGIKRYSECVRKFASYPNEEKIESLRLFGRRALDYSKKDLACFIIYQENMRREEQKENTLQRGDLMFGKERNPLGKRGEG